MRHPIGRAALPASLLLLAACGDGPLDLDLRRVAGGFSTTEAAQAAPDRPAPDARGVIDTGAGQVVVAQRDDTVSAIAARLGYDATTLAAYNGVAADATLRRDEVIALPTPVASAPTPQAAVPPVVAPTAGAVTTIALAPTVGAAPPPAAPAAPPVTGDAIRHQVQPGETAYSVARLYGVPVRTVADWNGLGTDLAVRDGQFLLVPRGAAATLPAPVPPGAGSATPVPPSAATPLPTEEVVPASAPLPAPAPQDVGEQAPSDARLVQPVAGSIIRAYAPGRNEGIDIGAPEGTQVRAADAGTVAAVTTNTEGVQIVVIRHADDLLTVYTNLDRLTVAKDAAVGRGDVIGQVRAGDPSFLHFEVRRGMQSLDPTDYLP
jgi:murein DD-endopeptidase MepM/ murein hydrolase activator NlpD